MDQRYSSVSAAYPLDIVALTYPEQPPGPGSDTRGVTKQAGCPLASFIVSAHATPSILTDVDVDNNFAALTVAVGGSMSVILRDTTSPTNVSEETRDNAASCSFNGSVLAISIRVRVWL